MTNSCDVLARSYQVKHVNYGHDRRDGGQHSKYDATTLLKSKCAQLVRKKPHRVRRIDNRLPIKMELHGKGQDQVSERLILYGFEN
jgi:hypothetical protein